MTRRCPHCTLATTDCQRCDRDLRLKDLDGHEGRHGLYHMLAAEGGQNHE